MLKSEKNWIFQNFLGFVRFNDISFLLKARKHSVVLISRQLQRTISICFEANWKFDFLYFVYYFYIFLLRFGAIQIFSYMYRTKIVHILIDKLSNCDFSKISVCFISDQSHREDVAERRSDKSRSLPNQ